MLRLAVLALLLGGAAAARAADDGAPAVRAEDQPIDPGRPSDALKSFQQKPSADDERRLEKANPDPVERSLVPLAAGAGALVLPFLGWLAFTKLKGGE
ncbi:MAG: hypothetical protein KGL53_06375 [Elusimicrobia bacterium]|nr:hypothetical protein [Elusimicrobiota bacterium]